jgi:hypothetical protein
MNNEARLVLQLIMAQVVMDAIQAVLFYHYQCALCPIHGIERIR